jgi:vitellogenic carboxypeptidase-like protein
MRASDDRITSLPGTKTVAGVQFAGYVSVKPTPHGDKAAGEPELFYWLAGPSEDLASKPVVLWTNGGPGSPSFWGVFTENGPYNLSDPNADSMWPTLTPREKAWNNYVNYLVIEHPLGCTLSFENGFHAPATPQEEAVQYYAALLNVLRRHGLTEAPLVISGESYAGTYLPLLAQRIVQGVKDGELTDFRGLVLGDAWVDPETQLRSDTEYALQNQMITPAQKSALDAAFTDYTSPYTGLMSDAATQQANAWLTAWLAGVSPGTKLSLYGVGSAIQQIWSKNTSIANPYMTNIGQPAGKDPDLSRAFSYVNRLDVRKALHVPDGMPAVTGWGGSNPAWNNWNQSQSVVDIVQELLDHASVKVLVLSGLNDAKDCNWLGTQAWLMNSLQPSPEVDTFRKSEPTAWHTGEHGEGPDGGTEQGTGRLRWLKILNAGHMAPMDQPDLIFYITSRMFG